MRSSAIGADVVFIDKYPWINEEPWWKMRNRKDITLAEARALARQSQYILAATAETYSRRTVRYGDAVATSVTIIGTTEQAATVSGLILTHGRFLTAAEVEGARPVCVLGADVAANFFPFESPLDKRVRVGDSTFEVVGVISRRGTFLAMESLDNQVFMPITRFNQVIGWRPNVNIRIKVTDIHKMPEAREEFRGILRRIRNVAPEDPDDFAINEQKMFIEMFQRVGGAIAAVGLFITGLSLFVGGIGIMNIMFVSVAERTKEIGLRKALGAKPRAILLQFLLEAALICLLGGLIGLGLAWGAAAGASSILPMRISPLVVSLALGVSLVTGIIAGFFPAWRAAKMDPVEALRVE
ncbi:MAG: transporter efflux protein [Verrucomicrobia bacterium]|nr:transporter efflux protein [Verrucomicrobiota bacterium]